MKIKIFLVLAVLSAALSGCMPLESNVENLMQPPKLTALQAEVNSALREAVGNNFILKYPVDGDYRSAFNFMDVDGDGADEAVAFVSTGNDNISIALLRQYNGSWLVSDLVPGQSFCTEVDFVSAHKIGDVTRLLVGWGGTGHENNLLTIYGAGGTKDSNPALTLDSRWDYSRMAVTDIDKNGTDEMLLLLAADSYELTSPMAQLVGQGDNGILDLLAETELPRNISSFYTPVIGELGNDLYGAAVDAVLSDGSLCTVTVTYNGSDLSLPLIDLSNRNLFKSTIRTQKVLSCDMNHDGIVDIPVERLAEGYRETMPDAVYLVDYSNLKGNELVSVQTAYINSARGYRLLFPVSWNEHPVSVLVQPDNSDAVFFINSTGNLYDHSKELLRIHVYSTLDGQDKLAQERSYELASKGTFIYSAVMPIAPIDGLKLTEKEIAKLFSLTS